MSPELVQFIALVFGTMGGTAILKRIVAALTDGGVPSGDAAKYTAWLVAFALTFLSYAYGWSPLPVVSCPDPAACLSSVAAAGSAVAALAGLVYDAVRKFLPDPEPSPVG